MFPTEQLIGDFGSPEQIEILMVEDPALCERRPYHQQKLTLVLAAMRNQAELLRGAGFKVHYSILEQEQSLASALKALPKLKSRNLCGYVAHSRGQARWIEAACTAAGCSWNEKPSPSFLTDPATFQKLAGKRAPLQMGRFYKAQRTRLSVLLEISGEPQGGRWSFDEDNRRKLPKNQQAPTLPLPQSDSVTADVAKEVAAEIQNRYPQNMGAAERLWLPTDRAGALEWLSVFLEERLIGFGTYEDAISQRSWSLFHSTLSPLINIGLLTPREVLDTTLTYAQKNKIPINDLEGFVRQLIGWREFIKGVDVEHGKTIRHTNSRNQTRRMSATWQTGELGIPPFDDAIATLKNTGWNHHIDRLMVIANLMNLAEIEPGEVYEFFMTHYIDAYEWVMVPNVYGMGLNSDDNTFATKPYICGSNYWLKMSDYSKGPWCDVVDGLYWRFVDQQRDVLSANPRTAMMLANFKRLKGERKQIIFSAADEFLAQHTSK